MYHIQSYILHAILYITFNLIYYTQTYTSNAHRYTTMTGFEPHRLQLLNNL